MTELSTHVIELDLTSVCVNTGVVQLPMRMQPYFEDGHIQATIDGEPVPLEFSGPRRLGGFRSHFEKRGLNANDKIRFELTVQNDSVAALNASCVKRERSTSSAASKQSPQVSKPEKSEQQERDRPQPASKNSGGVGERGGWGTDSTVRAVRRVTIRGSESADEFSNLRTGDTQRLVGPSGADTQRSKEGGSTRWQPLDGLSAAVPSSDDGRSEFTDTTVRAVRRGARAMPEAPAETRQNPRSIHASGDSIGAADAHETSSEAASQRAEFEAAGDAISLADLVVPAPADLAAPRAKRPAPIRPRIVGRSPRAEREDAGFAIFTPAARANGLRSDQAPVSEPLGERELVPVVRSAATGHAQSEVPAATEGAPSNLSASGSASRSGAATVRAELLGNGTSHDSSPEHVATRAPWSLDQALPKKSSPLATGQLDEWAAQPVSLGSGGPKKDAQPTYIDDADFVDYHDLPTEKASGHSEGEERSSELANGTGSTATEVVSGPDAAHDSTAIRTTEQTARSLEDDVSDVSRRLERPDTPAIVRSDVVAEELGLDPDRCERALERLSEKRERVSRIRKGAYMIRRDTTQP